MSREAFEKFEKWCNANTDYTYWECWQAAQAQAGDGEAVGKVYYTGRGFLDVDWFTSDIPDDALLYTAPPAAPVNRQLLEALQDARSALRYIRETHGELYGVGFDRVETSSTAAIAAAQEQSNSRPAKGEK